MSQGTLIFRQESASSFIDNQALLLTIGCYCVPELVLSLLLFRQFLARLVFVHHGALLPPLMTVALGGGGG